MTTSEVNSYSDLLKLLEQKFPDVQVTKLCDIIGISWGTYNNIKRGQRVRDTTLRKVRAFAEKEFGMQVRQVTGTTIQIVQSQTVNVKGDYSLIQGGDEVKELREKIGQLFMDLEHIRRENESLKKELEFERAKNKI